MYSQLTEDSTKQEKLQYALEDLFEQLQEQKTDNFQNDNFENFYSVIEKWGNFVGKYIPHKIKGGNYSGKLTLKKKSHNNGKWYIMKNLVQANFLNYVPPQSLESTVQQ